MTSGTRAQFLPEEPSTSQPIGATPIPVVVRRNTLLLSAAQALYTVVAQINVLLGAFMILELTGDLRLAGLGTAIAWGGRLIIVYQTGRLMDRFGRVKILQLGTLLSITGAIAIAGGLFARSLETTVSGLLIYGLGVGATNQNRVAVADMFPSNRRGEGIGYLLTASVVGALAATPFILVGTVLASLFGYGTQSLPYAAVLWLTTVLLLGVALVTTTFVKPEPKTIAENLEEYYPPHFPHSESFSPSGSDRTIRLLSYPVMATFAISGLTQGNMTMNMAFVWVVLHFHGVQDFVISIAITLHIVGMYALSTPLGLWADKFGRRRILMLGAAISGIGALVTPLATEFWTITLGIFLVGLGWSAATVASTALLSDMSRPGERGRVIGLNDVVLGAAALIFPLSAGLVLGPSRNFLALATLGFLASIPAFFLGFFMTDKKATTS